MNNMNKKLKTTLTLTAAVAGATLVGATNEAKAENLPQENKEEVVAKQEVEAKVTKEEVQNAKESYESAKAEFDVKKTETESKAEATKTAKEEAEKLQNDLAQSENVTDETIAETDKAIEALETKKEETKAELDAAKTDLDKTKEPIESSKEKVADAESKIKEAEAKRDTLQTELDSVKDLSNEIDKTREDLKEAQKEVDKASVDVANKEAIVAKESAKDSETAKLLQNAQKDLDAKKQVESERDAELAVKEKTSKDAKTALDNIDKPFGDAETTVSVSDEFIKLLNDYREASRKNLEEQREKYGRVIDYITKTPEEQAIFDKLLKAEENDPNVAFYPHGDYYLTPEQKQDLVNINNMSEADQLHFAQYATHLLNQIRAQFGKEPLKLNLNTQKFAQDIAKIIVRDNFNEFEHHRAGINEAAKNNGLHYDPKGKANAYENLFSGIVEVHNDQFIARKYLYDMMRGWVQHFFYEGNLSGHYGHAYSLLDAKHDVGISLSLVDAAPEFESRIPGITTKTLKMSVIGVNRETALQQDGSGQDTRQERFDELYGPNSKYNIDPIKIPDRSVLEKALADAKDEEIKAKANLTRATIEVKKAELELKRLQSVPSDLAEAQKALDTAKVVKEEAEQKLQKLEAKFTSLQKAVADQDAHVLNLRTKLADANNELTEARELLKVANEELARDTEANRLAKEKVANLESELAKVEKELNDAKTSKERLVYLKENKAKLEVELEQAKAKHEELAKELIAMQEVLTDLAKDVETKYDAYVKLQERYNLENLVYVEPPKVPNTEVPKVEDKVVEPVTEVAKEVTKANAEVKENKLPNTGANETETTALGIVMTMIAAGGALAFNRRKTN